MVSGSAAVWNNTFHDVSTALRGGRFEARNNIFDLSEDQVAFGAVSELDESHNLHATGTASSGSFVGDPRFVDAEGDAPDLGAYECF